MTSAWTNHTEVKIYAATKWNALNVSGGTGSAGVQAPFSNEATFDTFIDGTLIPRAQSHINRFCKRDFDVDFPGEKKARFPPPSRTLLREQRQI